MGWTMADIIRMDTQTTAREGRRANTRGNLDILESHQKLMTSQKSQSQSERREIRYMMVTQMIMVIKGIKIGAEDKIAKDIRGIPGEEGSDMVGFSVCCSRRHKLNR